MPTYYHVAHNYTGGDLLSLYEQHGEDAYEMYADKWPDAGELAQYHTHYIHLHETLVDAQTYQSEFGGTILEINADELEIKLDTLEYKHPMVRDYIEEEYIREVK